MLEPIQQLIEAGKLSAVTLKISIINGEPVVVLNAQTDGVSADALLASTGEAEQARNELFALRSNLARPIIFKGADIESQLAQAVPLLSGSLSQAKDTVDALSVAAKLDSASAKGQSTVEVVAAKKEQATKAKPAANAKSDTKETKPTKPNKKDAVNKTDDTVVASEPVSTQPSADAVADMFNFDSL